MGRKENKKENKKDKGQSDQKKSPPTDSGMRVIGQKRKRQKAQRLQMVL